MILKELCKKEKKKICLNIVFIILFSFLKLLKSPLYGYTIKKISIDRKEIGIIILLNIIYFFSFSIIRIFQSYFEEKTKAKFFYRTQKTIYSNFFKMKTSNFLETYDTSKVITLIINESKLLVENYFMSFFELFYLIVSFIIGFIYLFSIHFYFVLFISIASSLAFIVSRAFAKKVENSQERLNLSIKKLLDRVSEDFHNYINIKLFLKEVEFEDIFAKENYKNYEARLYNGLQKKKIVNINDVVGIFIMIGCNIIGVYLIYISKINVGDIVAVNMAIPFIVNPIFLYTKIVNLMSSSKSVLEEVEKLMNSVEIDQNFYKIDCINKIEFANVSYGYKDNILNKNINITFKKGNKYLILGESGVGKSSFVKLLLKLKEDYDGEVKINGKNIKNIDEKNIYSKISVLFQKNFIIKNSFKNNILFFGIENSEKFENIINKLNIQNLYENKKNLSRIIPENLSGGEIQRINLARCLYKETNVLILDEAFSSLDTKNSDMIEKFLLNSNLLIINISHRINYKNLKKYDKIIIFTEKDIKTYSYNEYLELIGNENLSNKDQK